jgi:hypothetical protein
MMLKQHAGRLAAAIPESLRQALAADPEAALSGLPGIRVVPLPHLRDARGAGGWCDGLSFMADGIICYAPSPGSRRQNFTLLHEFAHLCVSGNDVALDWLADRADPSADLEHLCDAIAAEILIPAPVVTRLLAGSPPEPGHLKQLYASSSASEEVCAIALAAHIPVRGAVLLIRRDTATVTFAASSGYPPLRIPRDLPVPPRHPLRDLGTRQRWAGWTTADLRQAFTDPPSEVGNSRITLESLLRTQAEAGPRRTTAILRETASPVHHAENQFRREEEPPPDAAGASALVTCPACGQASTRSSYPCEDCGVPPCPACGSCCCLQ